MFFYIQGPNKHDLFPVDKFVDRRVVNKVDNVTLSKAINSKELQHIHSEGARHKQSFAENMYQDIEEASADKPAVFAHQIMSSPVDSLLTSTSIAQAFNIFQSKKLRHLPVISSPGKVVGMMADRDIFKYNSTLTPQSLDKSAAVTSIMQSPVITAGLEADIRYIARLFVERHIGAMPIVLEGELKGIITRSDILRALIKHYEIELWI